MSRSKLHTVVIPRRTGNTTPLPRWITDLYTPGQIVVTPNKYTYP